MRTMLVQFAEAQKRQFDALLALPHVMLAAGEKVADLNLAAAKALMDESAVKGQALLGVKDVRGFAALASGLMQPAVERAMAYGRNAYSIASGTDAEVSKIVEAQVAEGSKAVAHLLDVAATSVPMGGEPAVSMARNVIAAANTAYDAMAKTAKHAIDIAEGYDAAARPLNAASISIEIGKTKPRKAVAQ